MRKAILGLVLLLGLVSLPSAADGLLAFPGAQGYGRFATGGRTGSVYHVTNLNDSGSGSLRDAISQSNRIIVFDVSGVIKITDRLVFKSNQYIAGQTAPGEGIVVYGNGVSFSGANNIIVRHIRFRMGKGGTSGKDCAGIANGHDMIFDHCSFSWGLDETFSINPSSGATCQMITIQNCIMGQGLLAHSAGGLMQSDSITLYRNLYCDNGTRNNKVKGALQYVNNIVYNWKDGCLLMGGDSSGKSYVNATNNLFINGPSGGGNAITSGNADFHIFAHDNWQDKNKNGLFDPYEIPRSEYGGGPTFESQPFPYPALETWAACELIDKSLPAVGASLPYRDLVDCYMVHQVKSFGKEGALLSTEEQLPFGVPTSWTMATFTKPTDTDKDGMPNEWEVKNGTNQNVNDAMQIAANGYTNIENYINSLSADNRPLYLRAPMMIECKASTATSVTISWADYTEDEDGFILEQKVGDNWQEAARIEADKESYTLEGLEAGNAYQLRLKAYKGEAGSGWAEVSAKTLPEAVDMVDVEAFTGEDGGWLIDPTEDTTIQIDDDVAKTAIVVRSDADITLTGTGHIAGTGSMNKAWNGKLTVLTDNSYTGATVLHGGIFSFPTLKNGGENSAIGASIEYAQNWIWNGGVWNYTGQTTTTNRAAKLLADTEFNIENAATVNMTGHIEGDGNVEISGKGTLVPAAPSFFKWNGNTVLKDGGTLKLTYVKEVADKQIYLDEANAKQKLIMAGGNFKVENGNTLDLTYWFPIEVEEGTYSTFAINRNAHLRNDVTGTGTLEYQIPYVREYLEGNWQQFYGTLVARGMGSDKDGSQLMLAKGFKGLPNTRIELRGNTRIIYWDTNGELYLGGLSGESTTFLSGSSKQTDSAKMIWHVGGANSDETFKGVIDNCCSNTGHKGTVSIVKEGSGVWRLTGNNIYSGTTKINDGKLVVNGTNSGAGAYTVESGGTLAGKGNISGGSVSVRNGGCIQSGDTLTNGLGLKLSKLLTILAGGEVYIPTTADKANTMSINGKMNISQGATLRLDEAAYQAGTELTLFKATSGFTITGSFAYIYPEAPGAGLAWDTSELYSNGKIRVAAATDAINNTEDATKEKAKCYTIDGRETDANAKGLKIKRQGGKAKKIIRK